LEVGDEGHMNFLKKCRYLESENS